MEITRSSLKTRTMVLLLSTSELGRVIHDSMHRKGAFWAHWGLIYREGRFDRNKDGNGEQGDAFSIPGY